MATQIEPEIARRRFTAQEFLRMAETGILTEDDRVELIEGEIVEMHPIGVPHHRCVTLLTALLIRALGDELLVSVQAPVRLGERGLPQPDLAVVPRDALADSHVEAREALLVIEVADASLRYDREVKLPLYARYGCPETWIVDLHSQVVEAYADPVDGRYRLFRRAARGEQLESSSLPPLRLAVDDFVG